MEEEYITSVLTLEVQKTRVVTDKEGRKSFEFHEMCDEFLKDYILFKCLLGDDNIIMEYVSHVDIVVNILGRDNC